MPWTSCPAAAFSTSSSLCLLASLRPALPIGGRYHSPPQGCVLRQRTAPSALPPRPRIPPPPHESDLDSGGRRPSVATFTAAGLTIRRERAIALELRKFSVPSR